MMKRTLNILFSSLAFIWLATGCSQIYDDSKAICHQEQPVTIIASIDNANTRAGVMTRSNGAVKPDDSVSEEWRPEYVAAEECERTISHVFLFVYKKGESTPHKVFFYYAGDNPLQGLRDLEADIRPLQIPDDTPNPTSIQMDLELLPGTYNFVMLVNSKAALAKMKEDKKITHPEQLEEENTIFTSDELTSTPSRQYLPMVGQRELYVPDYVSGSENSRYELTPDIKLERVHARVEFILTTANDAGTEYLSPILPLSQVKGLTLENEPKTYTVMPSDKDYTVTGAGQSNPIRATALNTSSPPSRRDVSYHEGTENAEGKIDKFKERLLPYDQNNIKYIYVAPSTLATSESECLTLVFKVRFANDAEDTVYKIPLTNVGEGLPPLQKFVTRRNTIYRINAKLIGRDLSVLDYNVIDWTNQDVDIPW